MIPIIPSGYRASIAVVANTPQELASFEPTEWTLPQLTRVIVEVPLSPSEDIQDIAQRVEEACVFYGFPNWPEYPSSYTFVEGNTLYITYVKASPWIQFIMPILLAITIIGPIIMWFVSDTFREIISLVIMLPILFIMMSVMRKMIPGAKPAEPKPKLPPWEERVDARLSRLGERIAGIRHLLTESVPAATSEVTDIISSIEGITKSVKRAPETVMSGYEKSKAADEVSSLYRRLAEYEEHLTPRQKEKLAEERRVVKELREVYP